LNRALAAREGAILPLIAETGGLNTMIVDSTALPEQVVDDAITSAFSSAGQRCSALRLLCLQEDIADRMIEMLVGATNELVVGNPAEAATDIGPVISEDAKNSLMEHVERMGREARILAAGRLDERHACGSFVAPHLIELKDPAQLTNEQFGPILHMVRYKASELDQLLAAIRRTGYGLTLGVQTRLESTWQRVLSGTTAGNVYVNRNMIGAVVGVQPFGGQWAVGDGAQGGRPTLPGAVCQRARADCQHDRDRGKCGVVAAVLTGSRCRQHARSQDKYGTTTGFPGQVLATRLGKTLGISSP
jgi:RHH-type proline utilization regulon transcriptional repressor/proline dehydrogenase/delta 1-pyrroline-5-carboxylate dehydrogenase